MKVLLFGLLVSLFGVASAMANSGGTNKYGCHHETATGGYHCH